MFDPKGHHDGVGSYHFRFTIYDLRSGALDRVNPKSCIVNYAVPFPVVCPLQIGKVTQLPRIGFICPVRPVTTLSIAHWWLRRQPVLPNEPISKIHNSLSINWNRKPCVNFSYKNEPKYDEFIIH
jgi:hypothetical protein